MKKVSNIKYKFLAFIPDKKQIKANQGLWQVVLLICLPCLLITFLSLVLADVSGYLIAFLLIVLSLVSTYVVVASKQRSEHQLRTLSNIVEAMIQGDYTLKGRLQANQALQELLDYINKLSENLSRHKIEAKESRLLLEKIMEQMDAMVFAVNDKGFIVMANLSAQRLLLNIEPSSENFNQQQHHQVKLIDLVLGEEILKATTGIINFNQGQLSGEHLLTTESFISEGKQHQLYLITNAERLLMEKERNAWQSLLRVLSHEMNNSLTPITAISQSMQQKLQQKMKDGEVIENTESLVQGIGIIHERSQSLTAFIASYSQLTHLPQPIKNQIELKPLLTKTTQLFPKCSFEISASIRLGDFESYTIEVDSNQFEQVLINLFKNAVEAMEHLNDKAIQVECLIADNCLKIKIKDQGQGIANINNLFVPFYSTKPLGSGIGLTLSRQILFNHGGTIKLFNQDVGAQAIISLPISH
ncbi:MAG: ATP-binding protein [Colwellia sp.]|nr:ATP-binding protein [Colwellia sp.]